MRANPDANMQVGCFVVGISNQQLIKCHGTLFPKPGIRQVSIPGTVLAEIRPVYVLGKHFDHPPTDLDSISLHQLHGLYNTDYLAVVIRST